MNIENKNGMYYTDEKNAQIVISLLKQHGIKRIIASPGYANSSFVYSVQQDDFFELYSVVDERSAAYMACGMAEESGEPIVLSCTGATASRNYLPALTEAYYRKLPILAITSSQPIIRLGNNTPQLIDRRSTINDAVKMSVHVPLVNDGSNLRYCIDQVNKALLELNHHGKGPVHINLETADVKEYKTKYLPKFRKISRVTIKEKIPPIPFGKVAIFVGAHSKWDDVSIGVVECFCELYNAVVLYDHTSNYNGKYGIQAALLNVQEIRNNELFEFDLLIHLGNTSGAYYSLKAKETWRVNEDGELCNTFGSLTFVFEMEEKEFFIAQTQNQIEKTDLSLYKQFYKKDQEIRMQMKDVPFSNIWIASVTASKLPEKSVLHLAILNTLRSWNFFGVSNRIARYTNTGGFGIDGCISSMMGASILNPNTLYFGVVGDLAFFYDMNVLGNRHIGKNVRLLIVNNGCGQEFKNPHHAASLFGEETDKYIAAKGHYGNKSLDLVKNYAENLNYDYYSARNKEEFERILPHFIDKEMHAKPMIVEVFVNTEDETQALKIVTTLSGERCIEVSDDKRIRNEQLTGKEIVLWGCGNCFKENIENVKMYANVRYVCDNNAGNWGIEVAEGVACISPDELRGLENIYVVIMLEDWKIAFQVGNQLSNIGIADYDSYNNWKSYAGDIHWRM